jgi:precorrin-6Y C5,15-methyltransferase (decarboxylating)
VKTVYLIGVGMGNPETLTLEAQRAIEQSELLIGASRLLQPYRESHANCRPLVISQEIAAAIRSSDAQTISVLFSGDPGFYSGANALSRLLDQETVVVIPGISSVNYFCVKLRTSWQDCRLVSAHGKSCDPASEVQECCKVFFLTGGTLRVQDLCKRLCQVGYGHLTASAGENLSYPEERIVTATVEELAQETFADLSVLLVENPAPIPRVSVAPSLADQAFTRGSVPMTKESVRTLAVTKLALQSEDTVWDVGAGTGSVSVACGLVAPRGQVYAVEQNPAACELIRQNAAAFGTTNVHLIQGTAPEALTNLPAPDRVFVGGSSGQLTPILQAALVKNPAVRVVVTAVSLETLTDCLSAFRQLKLTLADVTQITAAQSKTLGAHHLMMGQNPVWIITGEGKS